MITLICLVLMIDISFLCRVIVLSLLHQAIPKQNLLEAFRLSCYRVVVFSSAFATPRISIHEKFGDI